MTANEGREEAERSAAGGGGGGDRDRVEPEVRPDHRRHILERPLLPLLAPDRPKAAPQQRAERIGAVQGAVTAAAEVVGASPVDKLIARRRRQKQLARVRAVQRRPDARERVRVLGSEEATILESRGERVEIPLDAPPSAAQVVELPAGREAQLATRRAHHRLARARLAVEMEDQIDAIERGQRAQRPSHQLTSSPLIEQVHHRRPLRGGERNLGAGRAGRARLGDAKVGEGVIEADARLDRRLRVVGGDDHRVALEKRIRTPRRVHEPLELTWAWGPLRCEKTSLSGSDSSRKSNKSCSTRYAPTQPECWSRSPGIPSWLRQPVRREAYRSA